MVIKLFGTPKKSAGGPREQKLQVHKWKRSHLLEGKRCGSPPVEDTAVDAAVGREPACRDNHKVLEAEHAI